MRYILLIICGALCGLQTQAQVGTGADGLYIASGTPVFIDRLVLTPSANTTINNTDITYSATPVNGVVPGTTSISRVYHFSAPVPFDGEVGILYDDSELGTNDENQLEVAYRQGITWITTNSSTRNTTTNIVSYTSTGNIYSVVTAAMAGRVLPVTFTRFSAALQNQYVQLSWSMGDIEGLLGFDIQFSNDGRSWNTAGNIAAAADTREFSFQHRDLNFSNRYYRIIATEQGGLKTYTKLVGVRNGGAETNSMHIIRKGSSTVLYFNGAIPGIVQVYDVNGRLLMSRNVQQQQVEISGIVSGAYIIHYVVDGKKMSKMIQL